MKKLFTLMVITALAITVYAQSPQKMSYQCVVRNSAGALVSNQTVGMKISILKGTSTGTVVFSETYSPSPQTNANGLVTVEIGSGTASVGTFAGIDWSAGPYFLKTETDPAGGTSYTITGTSQLLSVPYALYAKTAANGFSGAWADVTGKPTFAAVATSGSYNDLLNRPTLFSGSYNDLLNRPTLFSGSYNDLTNKPVLFNGTWSSLTGKPTTLSGYGITDADGSITNEIQVLSLSGTLLTLSNGGGTVTLPSSGGGDNWGTQMVVTNASLTGAGTTASPLAVANTLITPSWLNVQGIPAGFADGTDNIDDADNSITNEIQALSLSGTVLSLSNGGGSVTLPSSGGGDNWGTQTVVTDATLTGNGTTATPLRIADNGVATVKIASAAVTAEKLALSSVTSDKINAGAVTGAKIAQAGATTGQVLKWNSTTWAPANDETGGGLTLPYEGSTSSVSKDYAFSVTSTGVGVTAISGKNSAIGATNGHGVYGETSSGSGSGVYGKATASGLNRGVYGISESASGGTGVEGYAGLASGVAWGIKGKTNSTNPDGIGVSGFGGYRGVAGETNGLEGRGISGQATSATGTNFGVYGICTSSSGYGIYGEAPVYGVYGLSNSSAGRAMVGEATGTASIGVRGIATNTSSTGVWGEGSNQGVYGESALSAGKGVYGMASSTEGINYGVYGRTASSAGSGVYGDATSLGGTTYGVYGKSASDLGVGVYGLASSSTGVGYGVWGKTESAYGWAVYGEAVSTTGESFGVYGKSQSSSGCGVAGASPKYGTYGGSTGTQGRAIWGEALGTNSIGVYGKALADNSTGVYGEGAKYDFYAAGPGENYGSGSSIRWKRNIRLIPQPLEKVMAIRGVYFDWDEDHGGQHDVGMIAEEVGKVLPEIVVYEENGIDASGMDYSKITPLLLEAIKEQQRQIDELKTLVNTLIANQAK